jgi:hypothetical protein
MKDAHPKFFYCLQELTKKGFFQGSDAPARTLCPLSFFRVLTLLGLASTIASVRSAIVLITGLQQTSSEEVSSGNEFDRIPASELQ